MITRRIAILAGFGPAVAVTTRAFAGGEFWNDKPPSEWSEKDVQRLLARSPWAKDAGVQMNFSAMQQGGGPGPGGGGMGRGGPGMGGPGMGGPGMGGGGPVGGPPGEGPGGPPQFKAVVRWESAAPIRAALKKESSGQDSEFYVISVSGLPMPGAGRRLPGQESTPEGDAERRQQMQERMKQATSLQPKGRLAISPARIENAGDGTTVFFFARDGAPLSFDDKEVAFTTRIGPLEIKAKFILKEMKYQGKLAI